MSDRAPEPMTPEQQERFRERLTRGIAPFDLIASGHWCEECGRPKAHRLFGIFTGCRTCDEVISRHRCTRRPQRETLATGQSWTCGDCLSVWTATETDEPCPECGHPRMAETWDYQEGSQIATAPKYEPHAFTPFRNAIHRRDTGQCYQTAGGFMVHVQPGCRCPR